MHRFLLAFAAGVAMLASPASSEAASPAPTWTGVYIGVNAGYGWNGSTVGFLSDNQAGAHALGATNFVPPYNIPVQGGSFDERGWFGGFQAGYNWQFERRWLIGIEADINFSRIGGDGSVTVPNLLFPFGTMAEITFGRDISWFGTIRPRLGWLPADNLLFYVTGGLAFGQVKESAAYTGINVAFNTIYGFDNSGINCNPNFTRDTCMIGSANHTRLGWSLGGGAEYRFPITNMSVKIEYMYVNFGGDDLLHVVNTAVIPGTVRASFSTVYSGVDMHTVKFGVNWKL